MAFTDVEMAILAQLAYAGATSEVNNAKVPSTAPQKSDELYDFIVKNEAWLKSKLGNNYDGAIEDLKSKTQYGGYTIVKEIDDKHGSGFAAVAIRDPNNNVTVAARGTEGFSLNYDSTKDVIDDVRLTFSLSTPQQEAMEHFVQELELKGYDGYYFTGHSLGGNLANYGALAMKPISKVKGVVTFNAPGFNEAVFYKYAAEIAIIYDKVTNYQNENDSVSSIMYVPGNIVIIESSDEGPIKLGDFLGFDDHGINKLSVKNNGFSRKEPPVKDLPTIMIHNIIETIRDYTGVKKYTIVLGIIEIAINSGRTIVNTIDSINEWVNNKLNAGYKAASTDPIIIVDTGKLRTYAEKLKDINTRLARIDRRLDDLYLKVGLRDLFTLIQADLLTGPCLRISNCIKYLDETVNVFETTERNVIGQF